MSTNSLDMYYVLDPMCSWCWGFSETLAAFRKHLDDNHPNSDITWHSIMGGLAPDSDEPMPSSQQAAIQQHWHSVAQHTGAVFNFDFWTNCQPRRSTWPSCRAVIAAGLQDHKAIPTMISGIQKAYYTAAQNPSDLDCLLTVAEGIGLNPQQLRSDIDSDAVQSLFKQQRERCHSFGISGFPALVAENGDQRSVISSGYLNLETLCARFEQFLKK